MKYPKHCNPCPKLLMRMSPDQFDEYILNMNPVKKDLLNLIIWFKSKNSLVYPSQSALAYRLGVSRRYINKLIRELNYEGMLGKWYRHMKSCYYNLPSFFFDPTYRNRFAKLLPNISFLPYSFAFISLLFSSSYSELPEGVFKSQFSQLYLKENNFIKSYIRNTGYALPRAREASDCGADYSDTKTAQSSRGGMKSIAETTKNLFTAIASPSEKTFLIKKENEQRERNDYVTETDSTAKPDCLSAFSAEAIEYAGKELQAQRSVADPATWFICKCREYDEKHNQDEELVMSTEIPSYIKEIKSLNFTDFGKAKLCSFPEEAVRFADKETQKTSYIDNPGKWFVDKCKEYCTRHNFPQDNMVTARLCARYKFSYNMPLLRNNRVNRTLKRENPNNSNNSTYQIRPLKAGSNSNVGERSYSASQSHSPRPKRATRSVSKCPSKPNLFYEEWKQTDEGVAYLKLETLGTEYAGVAFKKFLHSEVGQKYYESVSKFEKDCLDIARSSFEDPTEIALKRCDGEKEVLLCSEG